MSPDPEHSFPSDPAEFLATWMRSHGNVRHFLEDTAAPPLDDDAQRAAGEAAAAEAVRDVFGLGMKDFSSGMDSVSGSMRATGSLRITDPDPDVPQDAGTAAFFDVDNTLIQGSSLVELAMGLYRKKFFRFREIAPIAWKQLKYRITGAENASDVNHGRTQALAFIKGWDVAELVALGEEVVDSKMLNKAYSGTSELAQMHLNAGQQVWLVTATPVQLAHILAQRFGFTGALGTVAETENGKFTGRLAGDVLHGPGKAHAVAALAAAQDLDLARCTAYSDSVNDIPMLSMTGTSVAINPDSKLKAEAKRRGWAVRDYRSMRRAVRTWGVPALLAAAFSVSGLRRLRHKKTAV